MEYIFPIKPMETEDFGEINVLSLLDYYKQNFLDLLNNLDSTTSKKLFIDPYSQNILNLILDTEEFIKRNITKPLLFDESKVAFKNISVIDEDEVIFILHNDVPILQVIVEMYYKLKAFKSSLIFNLIFIPGINFEIMEYMKINGILDNYKIFNFRIDLIPLECDLLSLELPNSFREIYLDKNYSSIGILGNAMVKLETCFGKIKNKYFKGDMAKRFLDIFQEKEHEKEFEISSGSNEIFGMLIFDRYIEKPIMFASNKTMEGLIDEVFGIQLNKTYIPKDLLFRNLTKESIPKDLKINKNNEINVDLKKSKIFSIIKCMHTINASDYIQKLAIYSNKKENELNVLAKEKVNIGEGLELIEQLKEFIENKKKENPFIIQMFNLLNLFNSKMDTTKYVEFKRKEQILISGNYPDGLHEYYESSITERKNLKEILRLMILESVIMGGINDYNKFKRDICNFYGYQIIFFLRELEKIEFLKDKNFVSNLKNMIDFSHASIVSKLNLINGNLDFSDIKECSFVSEGYCPLTLKLVEKLLDGGWNKIGDILKKIPGALGYPLNEKEIFSIKPNLNNSPVNVIFVVFVGGVTYAEIEGIRFLNRKIKETYDKNPEFNKTSKRFQFIIVTTSILNYKRLMEQFDRNNNTNYSYKKFNQDLDIK